MLYLADISERRTCQLVEISRTVLHYVPKMQPENTQLQHRMVELAAIGAFMPCFGVKVLMSITKRIFRRIPLRHFFYCLELFG